jgi:alpha-ketoglutarate-dependent taurine dioxygenase
MSKAPQSLKDDYVGMIGSYYPPIDLLDKCFTDRQLKLLSKQKVTRPFIINHHVTNEEILYYSISTIQEISPKLLWEDLEFNRIKEWVEENAIIHEWENNDILIWDNLKMQHKRVAFEGERMLWRTQFII